MELPAAENMHVQVIDCLATIRTGIDHHTISLMESLALRDCRGCMKQMSEQVFVIAARMRERSNVFARHDQEVARSLGIDIGKGDAKLVLVQAF